MKTLTTFTLAAIVLAGTAIAEEPCKCKPLPSFKLAATNGKTYTQSDMTKKATVVVFLKAGCPHNPKAVSDLNRLMTDLTSKVWVVGVVDLDAKAAKKYASELKVKFPLIADANKKVVNGFGAKRSLDMAIVCSHDKKVAQVWEGYNQASLKELVVSLPGHGGPTLKMDYSKYPKSLVSGCGF